MLKKGKPALLALADGTLFRGRAFGAMGEAAGEAVFNTSMTGYQEILSDPSYKGQIVAMTYTQIGNYGVNEEDFESGRVQAEGFIVREHFGEYSNFRGEKSVGSLLEELGVPGIEGIDTRRLVRHIREKGAQQAVLSSVDLDAESLVGKARALPGLEGRDLVREVSCAERYAWEEGSWTLGEGYRKQSGERRFRIVAYDLGVKRNILRGLVDLGAEVIVVPASTVAEETLALSPDAVFFSNGPGDPAPVSYAIEAARGLMGKKPIFGICLGHQIIGLALGGKTYKLKFGHRGGNQPVMDLATRKVEITAQNHGFCVDVESLAGAGESVKVTHRNLNDRTVEGLAHTLLPLFSVQYHPEASPGPHDAAYLFKRFAAMIESGRTVV